MKVVCIICSELLVQNDDIFYTRCGHVFHLHCLTQWLDRSKSCPQCREKVTQSRIHRIYFNFSNEAVEDTSSSLQERMESLKFQMLLKEKDIKHFTSKNMTLAKQTAGLRQEVRKLESEINEKNAAIHALKEQTKYFKERSTECEKLVKENARLKNKINEFKDIQMLVHAPTEDVIEMVGKTTNPRTFITYISVLKKELLESVNKCKQFRVSLKRLQDEQAKIISECESKKMELAESLAFCESEKMALQRRVKELEETLGITSEKEPENRACDRAEQINTSQHNSLQNDIIHESCTANNTSRKSHTNNTSIEKDTKHKLKTKESHRSSSHQELETTNVHSISLNTSTEVDSPVIKRSKISSTRKQNNENAVSLNEEYKHVRAKYRKSKDSSTSNRKERKSKTMEIDQYVDLT